MKYNDNGEYKDIYVKAFDTLPVGTEVDYDGSEVPSGWSEIPDPNTYSTDEVRIGTWINGKPLYRKVINFGSLPNTSSKNVSTGLTNVIYKNIYGIATNGSNYFPINRVTSQSTGIIGSFIYENNVYIETAADRTSYTAEIIIEYTKTTD